MNVNGIVEASGTYFAQMPGEELTPEELSFIMKEAGIMTQGRNSKMCLQTPVGELSIITLSRGYEIRFPRNGFNRYKLAYTRNAEMRVAEWICNEWDHLCWSDFQYVPPAEYGGKDPGTLDEMCVYYRNVRKMARVSRAEKDRVARLFLDFIFDEARTFADRLDLPFQRLHLYSSMNRQHIAHTDGSGSISYNANRLSCDADSIRETLVHELCHSVCRGHGKDFAKAMENAMLTLGLIPRPCAYSDHLDTSFSGPRFPIGQHCPGYNFNKGVIWPLKMDMVSLWKKDE